MKKWYLWLITIIVLIISIVIILNILKKNTIQKGDIWSGVAFKDSIPEQTANKEASIFIYDEEKMLMYTIFYNGTFQKETKEPLIILGVTHFNKNRKEDESYTYFYSWYDLDYENGNKLYKGWNTYNETDSYKSIQDLPFRTISGKVTQVKGQTSILADCLNGI